MSSTNNSRVNSAAQRDKERKERLAALQQRDNYNNTSYDSSEQRSNNQRTEQQLKEDILKHHEQTVEILRRTCRTSGETIDLGHQNTTLLVQQGEQMDRIDDSLNRVEHGLRVSDKLLKGMKGIGGSVVSLFTSVKAPKKNKQMTTSTVAFEAEKQASAGVRVAPGEEQQPKSTRGK